MIRNLVDLLKISEEYIAYLKHRGVKFNRSDFPLFKETMFLNEYPDFVVPYDFRNNCLVKNPEKTLLCFYCGDKRIYPRVEKILLDIKEYKRFLGVVAIDLTVTSDMDKEWQDMVMLLHQLFIATLVVNKVKVVANLRIGSLESADNLDTIPKEVMWATGFLGFEKEHFYDFRFISSVLRVMPSRLVVYGPADLEALRKLEKLGIDCRIYDDYHKWSKRFKRGA